MPTNDEHEIWQSGSYACVMISCCSGAELQIRHLGGSPDVVLREMYPTKSDLYERARMLQAEYQTRRE